MLFFGWIEIIIYVCVIDCALLNSDFNSVFCTFMREVGVILYDKLVEA